MWAENQAHLKILPAPANALFIEIVILPHPVLFQKERPFQPSFLALAYRYSRPGVPRLSESRSGR